MIHDQVNERDRTDDRAGEKGLKVDRSRNDIGIESGNERDQHNPDFAMTPAIFLAQ